MGEGQWRYGIVGGGLAGWALAWSLVEAQGVAADEVVVIDEGRRERGSSAPATMVHAFPGRKMSCRGGQCEHFVESWAQLEAWEQALGEGWWCQRPMVRLLDDSDRKQALLQSFQEGKPDYPELLRVEKLDAGVVEERFEGVRWEGEALVYGPAAVVIIPELVERVAASLVERGVQQIEGRAVGVGRGEGLTIQIKGEQALDCREVILAVGMGMVDWFPGLDLRQRAGEVMVAEVPGASLEPLVSAGKRVFVRPDGRWGVGSTYFDMAQWDERDDEAVVDALIGGVQETVPAIRDARDIEVWRGVRSVFGSDHKPLVGPVANAPGVYVFGAFGSKGLLWIPAAARRMAWALATGEQSAIGAAMRSGRMSEDKWRCPLID